MIGSAESPSIWRVAADDRPLGEPAGLVGVVEQRLDHVPGLGRASRDTSSTRSGRCPTPRSWRTTSRRPPVDLAVAPRVVAVDVADHVREQERVVQRRVKGALLARRAARDRDAPEQCVPAIVRPACSIRCKDHPGSSASRLPRAPAMLTKEMPTFISTSRSPVVSKVT